MFEVCKYYLAIILITACVVLAEDCVRFPNANNCRVVRRQVSPEVLSQQQKYFPNQQQSLPRYKKQYFPTPNQVSFFPQERQFRHQHHTQTNFIPNYANQPLVAQQSQQRFQFQQSLSAELPPQTHFTPQNQLDPSQQSAFKGPFNNQPRTNQQFNNFKQLPQASAHFLPTPISPQSSNVAPQFNQQPSFGNNNIYNNQFLPPVPTVGQNFQTNTFPQQPQVPLQQLTQQPQSQFFNPQFQAIPNTNQYQQQPQQSISSTISPEELRAQQERQEREKLIQKHEQFSEKYYQKELHKAKEAHQQFVNKQKQIKDESIATKFAQAGFQPYVPQQTPGRIISPNEAPVFEAALKLAHVTTTPEPPVTKELSDDISDKELEVLLQKHRQTLYTQLKHESEKSKQTKSKSSKVKSTKALSRDDLLSQLKLALAQNSQDLNGNDTYSTTDVVLPNGQKVQVIRTTDPNLIKGAQPLQDNLPSAAQNKPAELNYEDLKKSGLVPDGADFEVVRQSEDGKLQTVKTLPKEKPVTFVYLEEQGDGSFKVQGVKANGDKETKTTGVDVDNILKKIKTGELKLPTPTNKPVTTTLQFGARTQSTAHPSSIGSIVPEDHGHGSTLTPFKRTVGASTLSANTHFAFSSVTASPSSPQSSSTYFASPTTKQYNNDEFTYTSAASINYPTSTAAPNSFFSVVPLSTTETPIPIATTPYSTESQAQYESPKELTTILKNNGLYAMAKYLKQSGLDSILNETGPYTVFAPTDKAFKSLLVQLGGPDKADEKFKNNPRLLSGLLLHHVIPGSFEISSLQDEMTGVSLAGTQLRVNQYNMHDVEWNDVKVTTINGAMIVPDKQDIIIPQGVAHSIDRVMFPLPVGDILQTLQSDRERRFTQFLRAVFNSDLSELLQNKDSKTYTVFAPVDSAFANLTTSELTNLVNDKENAKQFVMKYITPGTLFSAGMRFYQIRDSLSADKPITLQKTTAGKIKTNNAEMLSSNIPATNGVIHVIDNLLS